MGTNGIEGRVIMAEEKKQLIHQNARRQALVSVQHFETETRLACAPEREITPIITSLHSLTMQGYCFTPDGQRVAIANRRMIYILDLKTRKIVQTFDAEGWVEAILVSPDGKYVITGGSENVVRFRDIYTGACVRTLSGHQRRILNLALSPDGRWLASGDYYALGLWDLKNGGRSHWINDFSKDSFEDMAFSADGQTLYLGVGKSIKLLDVNTRQFVREIPRLMDVHEIVVTSDEKTLVTKEGSNYSLFLIDSESETDRRIQGCTGVSSIALSPDGYTLATGHEKKLQLWDLRDDSNIAVIEEIPPYFSPIVFNRDGSQLITHGRGLQLYSLQSGEVFSLVLREPSRIRCSAFASNGRVMVTEGTGSDFNVWDLRTGKLQMKLIGNTDGSDIVYPSGRVFTFTPDGKLLITRANDMRIRVWDMARGRCIQVMTIEKRSKRAILLTHPNNSIIAYTDDETVVIRDLRTTRILSVIADDFKNLYSVSFTRDGSRLVTVDDKTIRQWDIMTGECLRKVTILDFCTLNDSTFLNYHRLIDPDKLTFIMGEYISGEKPPKGLYDSETGQRLLTLDGFDGAQIRVLPDGKRFLSCDLENNITEWSLETGKCLREFEGLPGAYDFNSVVDFVLDPDWPVLIAGTREGVFYFWNFETGDLLAKSYNLDRGYLWITPPDDTAKNGWLHTNRPDLISLLEADKGNGQKPEFLFEGDERFEDFLRIYNDSEMVMTRLNEWERHKELLQVWRRNKAAMDDHLLSQGALAECFLLQSSWNDSPEADFNPDQAS